MYAAPKLMIKGCAEFVCSVAKRWWWFFILAGDEICVLCTEPHKCFKLVATWPLFAAHHHTSISHLEDLSCTRRFMFKVHAQQRLCSARHHALHHIAIVLPRGVVCLAPLVATNAPCRRCIVTAASAPGTAETARARPGEKKGMWGVLC